MVDADQDDGEGQEHAEGGNPLGAPVDMAALFPVAQPFAKYGVLFQPVAQSGRAAGGAPGGDEYKHGGGQPRQQSTNNGEGNTDPGQRQPEPAQGVCFCLLSGCCRLHGKVRRCLTASV